MKKTNKSENKFDSKASLEDHNSRRDFQRRLKLMNEMYEEAYRARTHIKRTPEDEAEKIESLNRVAWLLDHQFKHVENDNEKESVHLDKFRELVKGI